MSSTEEFYFIKDELQLETKHEHCVATENFFCFLFLSLTPEGSSFFKRSSPSWYKQQIYSMIYTTAIWFLTYQDAFEAFSPHLFPRCLSH